MANIILEDWEDYDDKKITDKRDSKFFSCDEEWEVEYLIKKIKSNYHFYGREDIISAINSCCKSIEAPRPREQFVDCVKARLEHMYFER